SNRFGMAACSTCRPDPRNQPKRRKPMRDHVIAAVRTAVAAAVTGIVAWLAGVGINLDPSALEAVLGALAVGVVNLVLNWLAQRWPILASIMSLGMSKNTPTY